MTTLLAAILLIWPFNSTKPPKCGEGTECVTLNSPFQRIDVGVVNFIGAVYRDGKRVPDNLWISEKHANPPGFTLHLNVSKTDSRPEVLLMVWKL